MNMPHAYLPGVLLGLGLKLILHCCKKDLPNYCNNKSGLRQIVFKWLAGENGAFYKKLYIINMYRAQQVNLT